MKGNKTMIIKALERAWYKKAIVEEDTILEYEGEKVPCWGTLATAEEVAKYNETVNENSNLEKEDETEDDEPKDDNFETVNPEGQSDVQEQQKLEFLRDLAVENNIWIDTLPADATPADEIKALVDALEAKNIKLNIGV